MSNYYKSYWLNRPSQFRPHPSFASTFQEVTNEISSGRKVDQDPSQHLLACLWTHENRGVVRPARDPEILHLGVCEREMGTRPEGDAPEDALGGCARDDPTLKTTQTSVNRRMHRRWHARTREFYTTAKKNGLPLDATGHGNLPDAMLKEVR